MSRMKSLNIYLWECSEQTTLETTTSSWYDYLQLYLFLSIWRLKSTHFQDITYDSQGHLPPQLTEQRHRSFGKCYTVHPDQAIRQLGVYYIKMELYNLFKQNLFKEYLISTNFSISSCIPVKIYFHNIDQFLDLSGRMGYKISMGEQVQSQVSYEVIDLIPK